MQYAELIKFPIPVLTKPKTADTHYHAEVLTTPKGEEVLAVTSCRENKKNPYQTFNPTRHFFDGDRYATQFVESGKKGEGTISHYIYAGYNNKLIPIDKSAEVIRAYLKARGIKTTSKQHPIDTIEAREQELLKAKLAVKYKKITDRIDARMALVGELPVDFDDWLKNHVYLRHRYFFYFTVKSKYHEQSGYCSHCKHEFSASPVKHNRCTTCPGCGSALKCKALKAITKYTITYNKNVIYLQSTRDEFGAEILIERVFRTRFYIDGQRCGADGVTTEFYIREETRRFYKGGGFLPYNDDAGKNEYYMGTFMSTKKERWCDYKHNSFYNNNGTPYSEGIIYPHNLNIIMQNLAGTHDRNCDYAEVASCIGCCDSRSLHYTLNVYPVIENLVKQGLYNIAWHLYELDNYGDSFFFKYARKNEIKVTAFLQVDKLLLEKFAKININYQQYTLYKVLHQYDPKMDWNVYLGYVKIKAEKEMFEIESVLKNTGITTYQCLKYIKAQLKATRRDLSFVIDQWKDYLDFTKKLRLELTGQVFYPRDLVAEHDRLSDLVEVKNMKVISARLSRRYKTLKVFEYGNDKFIIVPLKSSDEFLNESKVLKHCVKNYMDKCSKSEKSIFGLRKSDTPETPYFTVELNRDYKLSQNRGKHNCNPPAAVKKFVNEWFKKVVEPKSAEILNKNIKTRIKAAV